MVHHGRHTDGHEGPVVVFLIGMRVNRWRAVTTWWPALAAMPRMLRELGQDPGAGLLGYRTVLGAGGPMVVQYWRDLDSLIGYAHDVDGAHRPAWRAFHERARRSRGAVGVWHETYVVPAGGHETVYNDMPVSGLAAAMRHHPVRPRTETARGRLARVAG